MEQDIPEKEIQQDIQPQKKSRFYNKPWIRITALVLAISIVFSIWANGAIHVRIKRSHEMDAATNYLVENTDYVNEEDSARLKEKLLAYQQATELEDYYRLAGTQIAEENYGEALDSIDKCIELYPGEDEAMYVDLLLKRACLLVLLAQNEEALAALDHVLEQQPDHADAYLIKAQIYAQLQQLEPLKAVLKKYLEYRPQEYSIRMVYAQTLFELQNFEEAVLEYQQLLETDTDQFGKNELWYLLGLTHLQLSNYAEAEEALTTARLGNSGLDGIDYYIGICQMSRSAYEEAVESFTASIDAGSMVQHSRYSRGVSTLMLGDNNLEAALEDLLFVSTYEGADADPSVKQQSDDLLAQLQEVIYAS